MFPRLKTPAALESLSNQVRNYEPFTMIEEASRQKVFRVKEGNEFYEIPVL